MLAAMTENFLGLSDQTWLYIDQIGILLGLVTGAIALTAFVYGVANYQNLRRLLTRNRFPNVGGEVVDRERWAGLVFTFSKVDTPRWVVGQCQPKAVGLVVSAQSHAAARDLQDEWRRQGIDTHIQEITDADDPADARAATAQLLAWLARRGLNPLAVDLTGGKVPMSLGAFMAAEEHAAATVYVSTDYDPKLNKPDLRTAKILRVSAAR